MENSGKTGNETNTFHFFTSLKAGTFKPSEMEVETGGKRLNPTDPKDLVERSMDDGRMNWAFDTVIRTLKCPALLRTCRFVCRSWNISACAVLRQMSVTPVNIRDEEKLKTFQELRNSRENLQEDFPLPFLKISANLVYEDDFNKVEKYLDVNMILAKLLVEFEVCQENFEELLTILKINSHSLTSLTIQRFTDFSAPKDMKDIEKLRLVNLKHFCIPIRENCFKESSYMKLFIANILSHSKLEALKLYVSSFEYLKELDFENVSSVHFGVTLDSDAKSRDFVHYFTKNPLRNLKKLTISVCLYKYKTQISAMISSVANSLEVLDFVGKLPLKRLPICPKVRELICDEGYKGDCLSQKFPSLKRLKIGRPPEFTNNSVPHFGVEHLDVNIMDIELHPDNEILQEEGQVCLFCQQLESYVEVFPGTSDFFNANQRKLCYMKNAIHTIQMAFPNLKSLKMGEFWDLKTSPGYGLNNSGELKDCPVKPLLKDIFPMQDFQSLKTLHIEGVKIDPAIIEQTLSKVPMLKNLKIAVHEDITAEVIHKRLGHLKEITIRDCVHGDGYKLSADQRRILLTFRAPLITLYCECEECQNNCCRCQDCDDYCDSDLCF